MKSSLRGLSCCVGSLAIVALLLADSPILAALPSKKLTHVNQKKTPPATLSGPVLAGGLRGPMAKVDEIVFAVRVSMTDHWYVNFGYYSNAPDRPGYGEGGRLCRLNLRTGAIKMLLDDPKGGVRDPQVHYDAKKIVFSYRKGGTPTYHLYEINVDGTALRQLTDGPDDDIEPTYVPDGGIVFNSSRCRRFVNCWFSRVTTLHRCDGDGRNIRMLSSNNDHDNTPWTLPDGRILYMRWEYVDRNQVSFHHLWTMNPDGTGQTVYYGNEAAGVAMLDAKPIPGTHKAVVSFSWGHGSSEHQGSVAVVDPSRGPDVQQSARIVTKARNFRDPYAMTENCFLAAAKAGLFVLDGDGNSELIYELPAADRRMECHEPRPLIARAREVVIPSRVDLAKPTGYVVLQDVYAGRNMDGVKPGEIKKLLVLQQVPKPVNFSGGMEPLTIGGTFTLAEILGTVPIEPDGSAYIELPAVKSLFFVALDEKDLSVKRMQSFLTIQPGETLSCVGCHEQRNRPPTLNRQLTALQRPPRRLEPIAGVPRVFDFPRDIQPILDRHCAECHNPDRREGRVDLSGDKTGSYTLSYETIRRQFLISDGRNMATGDRAPRTIGSSDSRLMKLIDGTHYKARLSEHETRLVRLWIETGATYPGTYAALGCGMYDFGIPAPLLQDRCGACHGKMVKDRRGKEEYVLTFGEGTNLLLNTLCNLSRPEKSLILRAPLAREAGGLALCKQVVFRKTDDPLYQHVLKIVRDATARLQADKRFDMPGFRPNEHYVREMKRFGILPASLRPDDPIDIYATDRAYWDSFDYRPTDDTP